MIAVVPGYISRSVAGSYDNEGKAENAKEGLSASFPRKLHDVQNLGSQVLFSNSRSDIGQED